MSTALKLPTLMTADEFLDWPGDGTGTRYELVNGVLRAQDAASDTHGTIHARLVALIVRYLDARRPNCRLVVAPGVQPRLRAHWNHRIPELGVTCVPNRADVRAIPDPVLLIEILSPSNRNDTWSNVPLYASVPSVQEILLIESEEVGAELLRRGTDGSWPQDPEAIARGGLIRLTSIELELALDELYRDTHLANG